MSRTDSDVRESVKEKRKIKAEEAARQAALKEAHDKVYSEYQDLYNNINSTYGEGLAGDLLVDTTSTEDIQKKIEELKKAQAAKANTQTLAESTAQQAASAAATQQAQAQEIAAKNTGLSNSRAGSLASNNTYGNVYANSVQGLQNQQAMTQADYLEKLGYAEGLQQQVGNQQTASNLNTAAAFMSSDENEKVEPNRDGKLPESNAFDAIAQLEAELGNEADYFDDDNIIKQLAQIETVSYEYKHPEEDGEDSEVHQSGFTAQSLEKIPLFKKCVFEEDGIKKINLEMLEDVLLNKIMPALRKVIGED